MSSRRRKPSGAYIGKEDNFQRTAIQIVRMMLISKGLDPRYAIHVPNGGHRHPVVAMKMKAQGVTPGYPDVMVFHPCAGSAGLSLELKVWPNKPSTEQLEIHELLRGAGWQVHVCYGLGEVEEAVKSYLGV